MAEAIVALLLEIVLLLGKGTRSFPKLLVAACRHTHGLYWFSATIATITHLGHLRNPKQILFCNKEITQSLVIAFCSQFLLLIFDLRPSFLMTALSAQAVMRFDEVV